MEDFLNDNINDEGTISRKKSSRRNLLFIQNKSGIDHQIDY